MRKTLTGVVIAAFLSLVFTGFFAIYNTSIASKHTTQMETMAFPYLMAY